jgi:hypothetical protein
MGFIVKRYLYLVHRWLGIVVCLFMAMWFFSGVVMLYVGYPKLSHLERLAHLPRLTPINCCADLNTVLAIRDKPDAVRLSTVNGKPRLIAQYGKADYLAVDILTGQKITQVSEADAVSSAQQFLNSTGEYQGSVDEDPWTHSRALDGFRPLHKVQMQDIDNTLLYVASTTGEVVRDATGTERVWNWVGSWIHWLYPFRGSSMSQEMSANIIIYSSLIGCFLTLTGIIVGVWRWRFNGQYKHGGKTPYKNGMMRWHHITGLVFGLITFTWILSGMLSMNPWKLFDAPVKLNSQAFAGGDIDAAHFPLPIAAALKAFQQADFYPCELEWRVLNNQGYYLAFNSAGQTRLLLAEANSVPFVQFSWTELETAAQQLMKADIDQRVILNAYDFYYYQRAAHTMTGHSEHRLPILRLSFKDDYQTWLHLDPYTGTWTKLDSYRRTSRWLFTFLHSWDWLPLLERRPLWDGLMISFSVGGFLLSMTGIIIGMKRLQRKVLASLPNSS